MSISVIQFNQSNIIFLNFENIYNAEDQIEHINLINNAINKSDGKALLLVNLKGFMPRHGFMEFATSTIHIRAKKVKKAAYIGVEKKNHKVFEAFDKYNGKIVLRKVFSKIDEALLWLTEEAEN